MKKYLRNPITLILGVPLLFIAVVAVLGYMPSLFMHPKHDFLYLQLSGDYYGSTAVTNYFVEDGMLKERVDPNSLSEESAGTDTNRARDIRVLKSSQLYIFDTTTWSAKPVGYAEAKKLHYDASSVSPDGYTIAPARSTNAFPFFFSDGNRYDYVLKKGMSSRPLPIPGYYYNNERSGFIAWIIE